VRNTAQVANGDTVCIVGCGGVGLNAVIGARLAGAATIVAVDPDPDKRTAARGFGAHHDLDPSDPDIDRALADLLGGVGADHVIVATGAPPAHHSAMSLLAPSGTLTIVGMPADGVSLQVSPGDLAGADQRIAGSKMGGAVPGRDIVDLAAAHLRGDFDLAELVSHRHEFHDINLAIDDVRRGTTRRSVVTIDHTSVSSDTTAGTP
jgi:Zn-dependent alcohol dehydrogenase